MAALSVLVVDDDDHTLNIFRLLMDYYAFPLLTLSGAEAQEYFQSYNPAYQTVFDVIAIHVTLPDMDSYQLAQRMRRHSKAKMVAITARYTQLSDPAREIIVGTFDGILLKPLKVAEIIPYLQDVVAGKIRGNGHWNIGRRVTHWTLIDYRGV